MSRRLLTLALAACLVSTLLPTSASAYVVLYDQFGNYRSWKKTTVQWAVAANGSKDLSNSAIKSALQAAFDSWQEVSCATIKFSFGGFVNANPNKDIFIRWLENNWISEVQDAAGVTTNWTVVATGPKKVEIFFNGIKFKWATSGTDNPFSNATDVQAVATHEIGHAIGLDHPRHRFSSMFFSMFPGQSEEQRSLEPDDKRGACFLYPAVNFKSGEACDTCWQHSQCPKGKCLDYGAEGAYCTQECNATTSCPEGFGCFQITGVSAPQCVAENEHCAPTGGNVKTGDYCYDHATCKSGRCLVLPESAICSLDCNPNAGGNGGCPSGMVCLGGKSGGGICFPQGDGQLGDSCMSPANCASFDCIGVGNGQGVCTSPCVTIAQCPAGFKCVIDFCLEAGSGEFGESCETMSECQSAYCAPLYQYCSNACELDSQCPAGSQCLGLGFCDAGATGEIGDLCGKGDGAKQCKDKLFCFYQAAGDELGTCMQGCDARFDSGCTGGLYCHWYYQEWAKKVVGVCVHDNGGGDMGEDCGGSLICKPHLVCANTDGLAAKCRQDCNAKNFLGCTGGASCVPLNLADNPKLGACHPKDAAPVVENPRVVETAVADDPPPDPELGAGTEGTGTTGIGTGEGTTGGTTESGTSGESTGGGSGAGNAAGGCQQSKGTRSQPLFLLLLLFVYLLQNRALRQRDLSLS